MASPFTRGKEASEDHRAFGKPKRNPYKRPSENWYAWENGWLDDVLRSRRSVPAPKKKSFMSRLFRRNPSISSAQRAAEKRAHDFFGRTLKPGTVKELKIARGAFVFAVGDCSQVNYRAMPKGTRELIEWPHAFKGKRPKLYVTGDGKALLILGGNFRFTSRGIVP
jgi:hypothetical protein